MGVGVGLQERAGKGDMPSRGHTQAYPLGAMALGAWAHRPRCRLYLLPMPLSLQPHPLPKLPSLSPSWLLLLHNVIICNNIVHCMLGTLLLWHGVGLSLGVGGPGVPFLE